MLILSRRMNETLEIVNGFMRKGRSYTNYKNSISLPYSRPVS